MQLSDVLRANGIVGAGGAGFPTHVKVDVKVDTVIVNGAECEPLLASDKWIIETEGESIVGGLKYIMEACGAKKGIIALKEKYTEQLERMRNTIDGSKNIDLFLLGDFYPAGDEFILVYEVTGRVVPEGGLPIDVGCLVDNVETVLNIFWAAKENRPVTSRWLTCCGEVRRPSVVRAHIGTSIAEIVDICGGATVEDAALVIGGPLMGSVETDFETPVTKTTTGIIVLPRDHEIIRKKTVSLEYIIKLSKTVCCQCTYCTELCPRYLLGHNLKPHIIMRQINFGIDVPADVIQNAFLCSECGLCEIYGCVMALSPGIVNRVLKERLLQEGYRPVFPAREISAHEMKDYRKVPTSRIINRLQISKYSSSALRKGVTTDPDRVEIQLKQHIGEASKPSVAIGDIVDEGERIAEIPEGKLGAAIHASIGGKVVFIDDERVIIEKQG
jgi:Na+-translocating ferredoxin:NAD+ oxidoreductase RnfC subunit